MDISQTRQTVLIVDDAPENIAILDAILSSKYKVEVALNGEKALEIAASDNQPDLILLDVMMPGMDGYEVCERFKSEYLTRHIPIIFVTAKGNIEDEARGFELGAVDYITKPISPPIVMARVSTHLALYDQNRHLAELVKVRTRELNDTRLEIIQRLGLAAEFKDNETGMHVIRMSHYARLMGMAIGMNSEDCENLLNASPMHDLGKIGIPDHILMKQGKLDSDEWELMKKHAEFGARIIGEHDSELLQLAAVIALSHHEKWDGSGYPQGLRGDAIPLAGRICAIADVFDALTTERPYKKAWPVVEAVNLIEENKNKHFDPALVEAFMDNMANILTIKETYAETKNPSNSDHTKQFCRQSQ
jgi:cyclic di-GMP phosphodiesterase